MGKRGLSALRYRPCLRFRPHITQPKRSAPPVPRLSQTARALAALGLAGMMQHPRIRLIIRDRSASRGKRTRPLQVQRPHNASKLISKPPPVLGYLPCLVLKTWKVSSMIRDRIYHEKLPINSEVICKIPKVGREWTAVIELCRLYLD